MGKKLFIGLSLTLVTCIMLFFILSFTNYVFPWQKADAIETTIEIGGLAKFPNDIENLEIEKRGSLFTRQFIIKFDSGNIEKWIEESKRLKNNKPKIRGTKKIYEIYPGENDAFGGKVEIQGKSVLINMSWS